MMEIRLHDELQFVGHAMVDPSKAMTMSAHEIDFNDKKTYILYLPQIQYGVVIDIQTYNKIKEAIYGID